MGFPKQGYWSRLPFPSTWDFPNPGIKPTSPVFQVIFYHCAMREAQIEIAHTKTSIEKKEQISDTNKYKIIYIYIIELGSPALQVDSSPTELSGKPHVYKYESK